MYVSFEYSVSNISLLNAREILKLIKQVSVIAYYTIKLPFCTFREFHKFFEPIML